MTDIDNLCNSFEDIHIRNDKNRCSKKTKILSELHILNMKTNNIFYKITNKEIRELAKKYDFKNQFDISKVDRIHILPNNMINDGFCYISYIKDGCYILKKNGFVKLEKSKFQKHLSMNKNPFVASGAQSENIINLFILDILNDFFEISSKIELGLNGRQRNIPIKIQLDNILLDCTVNQIDIDASFVYYDGNNPICIYCEYKYGNINNTNINQLYHLFCYHNERLCKNNTYLAHFLLINVDKTHNIHVYKFDFTNKYQPWSYKLLKQQSYIYE